MNRNDVYYLRCIECFNDLKCNIIEEKNDRIINGFFSCEKCNAIYPILNEVGIFFKKNLFDLYLTDFEKRIIKELSINLENSYKDNIKTEGYEKQYKGTKNWEYEWKEFLEKEYNAELFENKENVFSEEIFWKYIPLEKESIKNKKVFVGCGGAGREAYHISKHNPEKIFMNDLNIYIYNSKEILTNIIDRLVLLRFDVSYSPIKPETMDIVICDHALQHVYEPDRAFKNFVDSLNKDGLIGICVYSKEGNWLMVYCIEVLKKYFLSTLPLTVLKFLSYSLAFFLYFIIFLFYKPINYLLPLQITKKIPLNEILMFWSKNGYHLIANSCFDLLHAPIAYYFSKDDIIKLIEKNNIKILKLDNTYNTLWSLIGVKFK
ncbi:type 11 methyltransferase [Candidatus Magnetomorum sp. HK-1]|nr:type 11 methyltransferase [Candidatus Magnetomorum sp. HK-1]